MKRQILAISCILLLAGMWLARECFTKSPPPRQSEPEIMGKNAPLQRRPAQDTSAPRVAAEPPEIPLSPNPDVPVSAQSPPRRALPVTVDFLRTLINGPDSISIPLPDGRTIRGTIELRRRSLVGEEISITGRVESPAKGRFQFSIEPAGSETGPLSGIVVIDDEKTAFSVLAGPAQTSLLTELPVDLVICRSYAPPLDEQVDTSEALPSQHPTDLGIPAYQNGIIPLQSRPTATKVVYLDFDGEKGPFDYWGSIDAAAPNVTNAQIKDVWTRVCEDYVAFNVNITTDLLVFQNTPAASRQHCVITPTTTAAPGAGGVATLRSFGGSTDTVCWSFYATGKNSAEVIAHEVGHTLSLSHDGRTSPVENYYLGHGTDPVGWAPIMGAGYYKNLSQWSKGEYSSANNIQDDISIITNKLGARTDEVGATHSAAALLDVFSGGRVDTDGTIESRSDVDAFKFTTTGGSISLSITNASLSPDLDILAAVYDASNTLILSNNPNTSVTASLSTTLAAGEYTVRVEGVGRGDPLSDGYSDYSSLGQYTITGTIDAAVVPDRFTLAENPSLGATIGSPSLHVSHPGATLTYAITSGNTGSALSINPSTGAITVATPSALDYEALSANWLIPAVLDLTISVADSVNTTRDETLRVIVTVTNVNEAPILSGPSSIPVISHTVSGTTLGTYLATDPDHYDLCSYSIISGNSSGKFALNNLGVLTVTSDLDATALSSYSLTLRATDLGSPGLTSDLVVAITILPCPTTYTPGYVNHTLYENISGTSIASLTSHATFPSSPTREVKLYQFTDTTQGDNYGSTIRAALIAPYTGTYQFWVSGDNSAELYINTAGASTPLTLAGNTSFPTTYQLWNSSASQTNGSYSLTAGQICYLEARHKESTGTDHLSVAWQIKDSTNVTTIISQQVIPGRYLSPHTLNYAPKVASTTASVYRNAYSGSTVTTATATDLNSSDTHSWAITGGNSAGLFVIDPTTGKISIASTSALAASSSSSFTLTLAATDNGSNPLTGSGTVTVTLLATSSIPTAGLVEEFWDNINGSSLSSLYSLARYPERPDRLADLSAFDTGTTGSGDNYGARVRGYILPPVTGSYTFYISGDDSTTLLLSSDSTSANASQIASSPSYTSYQTWTTYPSQTSATVTLTAGQKYFIEARVKEGTSSDHLSVAWTGPSFPSITVISDAYTQPYDSNLAPIFGAASYIYNLPESYALSTLVGTPTATDAPFEEICYSLISGDSRDAFAIDPATGTIRIRSLSTLSIGTTYHLQIGAQDSGHGHHFIPKETLIPVTIIVPGTNTPPQFSATPVALGSFRAGQEISTSLDSFVTDPGDAITFSLISGPPWITLSAAGLLAGTPGYADFGPHILTIAANDGNGHTTYATVTLTVSAPASLPVSTLTADNASATLTTGTVHSGTAADASTADNTYLVLKEATLTNTSALDHRWTFTTTPNRPATLKVAAFHSSNNENDDFQFSISTDGGITFTQAIAITKSAEDHATQTFSYTAGNTSSTLVKVTDTDRTSGRTVLDTLAIDLLAIDQAANTVPSTTDASYQVASHAPLGVTIGSVAASDPDAGQTLSYSLQYGNESGLFSISATGQIKVAADIPNSSATHSLIVVVTDNGAPSLANYATITVSIVPAITATISLGNLAPAFNRSAQPVTVTTIPPGIAVAITYDGSTIAPTHAGSYFISATLEDPVYIGSATATQIISKSSAAITLSGLSQAYDGSSKSITVTTLPSGLAYDLSYAGSSSPPSAAGNYPVAVTIADPDYSGTASDFLMILGDLVIHDSQSLVHPDHPSTYQNLLNDGTLIFGVGTTHISGNATNHGLLRLNGNAILTVGGTFTNSGVIDLINWSGTLPPNLVNTGTILDRSAIKITATQTTATTFSLSLPSYAGHLYQLETKSDLTAAWQPIGIPVTGTGTAVNPPALLFSPTLDGPRRFYRVVVTPAP